MEIRKLNTLRGVAALTVVVSHHANATGLFDSLLGLGAGQYGVMLFFILSGFLMALLYLDRPCTTAAVRAFLVARVARVLPLYLCVVIASFVLLRAGIGRGIVYDIVSIRALIAHVLMLSGTSVLWTIPPEIQFYACFVLLWKLFSVKPQWLWVVMAALLAGGILAHFESKTFTPFGFVVQTRLVFGLPFFMVGMVLGHTYRSTQESAAQSHWFVLLLLGIPLLNPGVAMRVFGRNWALWQDVEPLLLTTMIFAGLVFLVPRGNRVLENVIGDFTGKVSFSLYLLHLPLLIVMTPYLKPHPLLYFPLFIAAALILASTSFRLLETPLRTLMRRLSHQSVIQLTDPAPVAR